MLKAERSAEAQLAKDEASMKIERRHGPDQMGARGGGGSGYRMFSGPLP